MSLEALWVAPGDIVTDVSGRFELPKPGEDGQRLQSNAEQGSAGSATVPFDDKPGDFYPVGLNAFRLKETTSEADDPFLFAGHFGQREEVRGPYRTGSERQVEATITDANAILERYMIRSDESPDRPEESESTRMTWLLGTSAFDIFESDTSMIDTGSTTLTKADLTDYTPAQILADMGQQTGKNFYVWYDGTANAGLGGYVLVYARDSDTHLTSALKFSNVIADVDDSSTFFAGLDFRLKHDPSRLASNVTVRYANGRVNVNNAATAIEFSRVDKVMDASLVKTAGVATVRATRYTIDLSTEEEIVSGTVYLPAAKASQFRAGMRSEMKVSYLTGMSDFVWVRLLNVTLVNISEDPTLTYALAFEGTFAPEVPAASCSAILSDIPVQDSGTNTGGSFGGVGDAIAGAEGSLTLGFTVVSQPHTAIVEPIEVGGGFTLIEGFLTVDGEDTLHTMSAVYYRDGEGGTPIVSWAATDANSWRQFAFLIPGATIVQSGSQLTTGSTLTLDDPLTPGNLVLLFRVAEGPTNFGQDPDTGSPAWTLLHSADETHPSEDSPYMDVWGLCVPEDYGDEIGGVSAGSAHWSFAVELAL